VSQLLDRLQLVQNAAAWLIFGASRQVHIMLLLHSLHWLRVPEWIAFRLAVLMYRCLHGTAPAYLSADLLRVSDVSPRQRLLHLLAVARNVPQSVTMPLLLPHRLFGTACRRMYGHPHRCSCSDVSSSLSFSGVLWAQDTPRDLYLAVM